jgi:ABC-2 type transport system permease protein
VSWRAIRAIARGDALVLWRDTTLRAVWIGLAAALTLATWNGASVAADQREGTAARAAEVARRTAQLSAPLSPVDLELDASLPPAPLAALAIGRARLDPEYASASFWSRDDQLFANQALASPIGLQLGGFDLAFVVFALIPLVIVALGHDLLARDRDAGRLAHLLSLGVSARSLLFARLAVRAALVAAPVFACVALSVAPLPAGAEPPLIGLFVVTACVVMAVWWSLAALANTWRARAESLAAALVALHVVISLLVPGVIAAAASVLYPPPSRPALTATLRAAEVAARDAAPREALRFQHDHPELQRRGEAYVADWMINVAMVNRLIGEALVAPLAESERAAAAQRRVASAAELLSPALAAQRLFAEAAGTGDARYRAFRSQARAYAGRVRAELVRAAFAAAPLDAAQVERFAFREEPPSAVWRRAAPRLAFWSGVASILFWFAARRAKRLSPA